MNTVITNVTISPITSAVINNGEVLIQDGKIASFGEKVSYTNNEVTIIDGQGMHLYPGFIDVHTHLGLYDEGTGWAGNDANETIDVMSPHIRAFDSCHPLDIGFKDAREFGITAAHIMPGSQNVIGGTTSVIKTVGKNITDMLIKETAGLKLALGENPKRIHSQSSSDSITRMGIMGMLRETFTRARWCEHPEDPKNAPIIQALKREIPVRIHAHRADDILSAVRFADEFELDLRIEHCTEGHLIADELSGRNLKVCVGPTLTRKSKIELKNKSWETYQALAEQDIEVSITTDHPYVPIQYLNVCAALAAREGLSQQKALEGITIAPARNLGVADRVGSIEIGKDADLVLWSGHPFDYMSKPVWTMINGETVFSK